MVKKVMLGYQLLSAYKQAAEDLYGTLRQIREMGYDGVEFIGFFGHDPKEVRAMLDELGLIGMSTLMPFANLRDDVYKVISDCKVVGCKYISILLMDPGLIPGSAGFAGVLRDIIRIAGIVRQADMRLLYHHHGWEFGEISSQSALDFMTTAVPDDMLWPELDCYWVKHAGCDPIEYIRKYANRCDIIHLKDYVGFKEGAVKFDSADESLPFEFKPVGHGWQDTPATVEAGIAAGAKWLVVEQDAPSANRTPMEDARMSIEYLRNYGL